MQTPYYYRNQAAILQSLARLTSDPDTRSVLITGARDYEDFAAFLEHRATEAALSAAPQLVARHGKRTGPKPRT